ncbi:MAG TPA: hypothetical protein VN878_09490, partial [Usitatibacter sp.]|nr:hypothetical protein [Usitatibacter sp.]
KRNVNARPTKRGWPGFSGRVPRIQTLRNPFFNNSVVMVAVVTWESVSTTCRGLLIRVFLLQRGLAQKHEILREPG